MFFFKEMPKLVCLDHVGLHVIKTIIGDYGFEFFKVKTVVVA